MSYYFIRFIFLVMVSCAITATGYAMVSMLDNQPHEAMKSIGIAGLMLIGALASYIESTPADTYLPAYLSR